MTSTKDHGHFFAKSGHSIRGGVGGGSHPRGGGSQITNNKNKDFISRNQSRAIQDFPPPPL